MPANTLLLLPQPKTIRYQDGEFLLTKGQVITIDDPSQSFSARWLQAELDKIGLPYQIVEHDPAAPSEQNGIHLSLNSAISSDKLAYQEYSLSIAAQGITIISTANEGVWYGVLTLIQIIEQRGEHLPLLTVQDSPDFARRGVMLDISRDKVPTMETLRALIDRLAGWKINELQLYMEHTFAYQNHRTVWENASPLTAEEVRELDQYCRERFIDLVPNQNSFGHMHRWLMHDAYRHMAEVPEGFDWPMFISQRPFSIAAEPQNIEFMGKLYDELLPNFTSQYFNVGCDETFDLGKGRSKTLVDEQGKGRVYVDYLKGIAEQVGKHGRTMQFWGDIIMQHPELVPELPKGVIAMEWGYEANHPFDKDGERFAAAGVPFYVCPGTSSWVSLVGRTDNAIGNLQNAAINGRKYGAMGYLNTDWGDYGHWQPLPVSYLGFAYGAALSWAVDANMNLNIPAVLDQFAFEDPAHGMGQLAYDLGNVFRTLGAQKQFNGAAPVRALYVPLAKIPEQKWGILPVNVEDVRAAMAEMDRLAARLDDAQPADPLVVPEYKLAAALWRHGCKRLLMVGGDTTITKAEMAAELRPLRDEFRRLWLARNRPGGLDDSLVRMDRLLEEYAGEPEPAR